MLVTRFIPLDGPGAKKLGGPPHAQKNILKSVPPPKKRAGPQKVGHGHNHQMYFTHFFYKLFPGIFFYRRFLGKKMWIILADSLIILQGVSISLLYAAYSISSFLKLVFSIVLHTMKWKEQCRELFNQYKEYMVELNEY